MQYPSALRPPRLAENNNKIEGERVATLPLELLGRRSRREKNKLAQDTLIFDLILSPNAQTLAVLLKSDRGPPKAQRHL